MNRRKKILSHQITDFVHEPKCLASALAHQKDENDDKKKIYFGYVVIITTASNRYPLDIATSFYCNLYAYEIHV